MTWGADYSTAPGPTVAAWNTCGGRASQTSEGPPASEGPVWRAQAPQPHVWRPALPHPLPGEEVCARTCSGCTPHGWVRTHLPFTAQCTQARWIQQADLRHLRSHLYPRLPLPSVLASPPPAHSLANASTPYSESALFPDNAGHSFSQQRTSTLIQTTKASAQLACSRVNPIWGLHGPPDPGGVVVTVTPRLLSSPLGNRAQSTPTLPCLPP